MKSRHIGYFNISVDLIETNPTLVKRIMGECIIVKAEFYYISDQIHYTAISNWFDELPLGHQPLEYAIKFIGNKWMFFIGNYNEFEETTK